MSPCAEGCSDLIVSCFALAALQTSVAPCMLQSVCPRPTTTTALRSLHVLPAVFVSALPPTTVLLTASDFVRRFALHVSASHHLVARAAVTCSLTESVDLPPIIGPDNAGASSSDESCRSVTVAVTHRR